MFAPKCFVSLFSDFYGGSDALGFSSHSITPSSKNLPWGQVPSALSETFLRAGSASVWVGFLPIHPENESLKKLFLFTHRLSSTVYIACEF